MQLNVNLNAIKEFAGQLKKVSRSALPVAIRSALNSAAFDVKKNTMPKRAQAEFTQRKPTFFQANSKVEQASGFNVSEMKATVGFISRSGDQAVDELEQQEHGGRIGGRSFIATKQARTGSNWGKNVRTDLRISSIKSAKIIDSEKTKAKSARQRFVRSAIMAKKVFGKNAFVLGNKSSSGSRTLSRIDRVSFGKRDKSIKIKRTPIYTYEAGRKVKIAGTNFMRRASLESGMSLGKNFQDAAIRQLKRYTNIK